MAGTPTMRGSSLESFTKARRSLDSQLQSGQAEPSLGADLYDMARNINAVIALRRVLTDPNGEPADKAGLVRRLFSGKVGNQALELVSAMAGQRWARPRDLVDAVETLGTSAVLADADRAGELDAVEDEIFRFNRIVNANPQLQQALTDRSRSADDKVALLSRLLADRVGAHTAQLIRQAVVDPRGRSLDQAFDEFESAIARRRQENLAFVTSAVPLSEQQADRLTQALGRRYGSSVHLNFDIDPKLVGGIRIRIGDDVIDGSIRTRLDDATRRLAG